MNEELTAQALVERVGERLSLTAATGPEILGGVVRGSNVSLPGLLLAGFDEGFRPERVQVLGNREVSYVDSLSENARATALTRLATPPVPCIVVADGLTPPQPLVQLGEERGVPVFTTPTGSDELVRELGSELEDLLAPQEAIHGTLVDVYGVGLLFTGKSGIGKSECGLDLVANGHRLVADDMDPVAHFRDRISDRLGMCRGNCLCRVHDRGGIVEQTSPAEIDL